MTRHLPHPPRLGRLRAAVAALPSGLPTTLTGVLAVVVIGPPLLMGTGVLVDAARHPLDPIAETPISASASPTEHTERQHTSAPGIGSETVLPQGTSAAGRIEMSSAIEPGGSRPNASGPDPRCAAAGRAVARGREGDGGSGWGASRRAGVDLPPGQGCRSAGASALHSQHPDAGRRRRGHDRGHDAGSRPAHDARRHREGDEPD